MDGTFFKEIYDGWQALAAGQNAEMAEALLLLWTTSIGLTDATKKIGCLYRWLASPDINIASKRKIFAALCQTRDISAYKKHAWTRLVGSGDAEREQIFYELVTPRFLSARPGMRLGESASAEDATEDPVIFIAMNSSIEAARLMAEAHKMNPESLDITDMNHWFFMSYQAPFSSLISVFDHAHDKLDKKDELFIDLFIRLVCAMERERVQKEKKSVRQHELQSEAVNFEAQRRKSGHPHGSAWHSLMEKAVTQYPLIFETSADRISVEEADVLLGRLSRAYALYSVASDKVKMHAFEGESPEIFSEREPLTRFLMTRFYADLPIGEQQMLLGAIKEAKSSEESLRIFLVRAGLEKVGQFLSFWPEVPDILRDELRFLQKDIPPSDIEEVKATIAARLPAGPERAAILKNLNSKPLGSGSIGECYKSMLSNGEEVVIKVITPSKERRFTAALARLRRIAEILSSYVEARPDEVPAASVSDSTFVMAGARGTGAGVALASARTGLIKHGENLNSLLD